MANLSVKLCGVTLKNPVIAASGTYGFGREFQELYDIGQIGGVSTKGMTLEPRLGNPVPRIAESRGVILNAVGLQNPGVEHFIECDLEWLKSTGTAVIANVAGKTLEDYEKICARLDGLVDMIELNISCPNVKHGGMSMGTTPEGAYEVTSAVRKAVKKPIFVKLTPNVTDISAIARAAEEGGADGLALINTSVGMRIDLKRRKPVLANVKGGFSGRAIFPIALKAVYEVYDAVKIPLIGIGGVATAEDVIEMMLAGATAVEVGAENLVNPYACKEIIENLPAVMQKYGIEKLTDIIGGAHRG